MRQIVKHCAGAMHAVRSSGLTRCWRIAIAAIATVVAQRGAMAAPLEVFVSILPQKYFVERVGGDAVKVGVAVRPGQSPEGYDPTPQQMVAIARAKAYFRIGVAFETDSPAGATIVPCAAALYLAAMALKWLNRWLRTRRTRSTESTAPTLNRVSAACR